MPTVTVARYVPILTVLLLTASSGSFNPGALSNCTLACISAAAADSSCLVATNLTCVCTDANFEAMSASCLELECQPADAGPALALQEQQCGTTSATAAPTATAPFTPSNRAADISVSVSGSASASASAPTVAVPSNPANPATNISASVTGSSSAKPSSSTSTSASASVKTGAGVALTFTSGMSALLAAAVALVGGALGGVVVL
ncbi:hypothetical protein B0H11DRAFT_2257416 [Mycena galericulata]|nr:hypothetical protein B0H11DRAFT_2257416 [Mycena galericulata]